MMAVGSGDWVGVIGYGRGVGYRERHIDWHITVTSHYRHINLALMDLMIPSQGGWNKYCPNRFWYRLKCCCCCCWTILHIKRLVLFRTVFFYSTFYSKVLVLRRFFWSSSILVPFLSKLMFLTNDIFHYFLEICYFSVFTLFLLFEHWFKKV